MADASNNGSLPNRCSEIAGASQDAIEWARDAEVTSERVSRDAPALVDEFRHIRSAALRLGAAAARPMCAGVFGPSQAGKSYLVSALARVPGQRLVAKFGKERADFLRDLNPGGGRESTGLVTRFTVHAGSAPDEYPVEVRLLSEADIVKILGNSFYHDFNRELVQLEQPDPKAIRARLDELEKVVGSSRADEISADDVFDIEEYFELKFSNSMHPFRVDFWPRALSLAPQLSATDRVKLFALLWWDFQPFSDLYLRLHNALAQIGFAEEAQCEIGALISQTATGERSRVNSIIDVATLSRLGRDDSDVVRLRPIKNGRQLGEVKLSRSHLAALVAELKIIMTDQAWPFLQQIDLLDFPGARSRLKITSLDDVLKARGMIEGADPTAELLLRGKVSYLFERYTAEHEMGILLVCVPWGPLEVADLPAMVDEWVHTTHGATPKERQQRKNGLFFVLTKFDTDLAAKGGDTEESERQRWPDRIGTALIEKFGRYDWVTEWDAGPFSNCYWLRNPEIPDSPVMQYDANGQELGIATSQRERLDRLSRFFIEDPLVRRHFSDPLGAWTAALAPRDGGIGRIVTQLTTIADPGIKERRIRDQIDLLSRRIFDRLSPWFSGENAEERKKKLEIYERIRQGLTPCIGKRLLGSLVARMHASLEDLRDLYFAVAAWKKADEAGAEDADKFVLEDLMREVIADIQPDPVPRSARVDGRALRFAEEACRAWVVQLRRLSDNAQTLRALHLEADTVRLLTNELITAAHRLGLTEDVARAAQNAEFNPGSRWETVVDRQALVAALVISSFVDFLGYGLTALESRPGVPPDKPRRKVFQPPQEFTELPPLAQRPVAAADIFALDWIHALGQAIIDNVGYEGNRDITPGQNAKLGEILSRVRA